MPGFTYNKNLLIRLHNVQGQLNGIEKMMHENRRPEDINIQLSAAEHALYNFIHNLFFEALQKEIAALLSTLFDKYADCSRILETLDTIHKNLGSYPLKELPSILDLLLKIDQIGEEYLPE
ncbi:MAG: metal-sensing transcriptional repressor [Bacteroidales bacterium]|jgi:DNA-binding FrmR family transcriptional regulator